MFYCPSTVEHCPSFRKLTDRLAISGKTGLRGILSRLQAAKKKRTKLATSPSHNAVVPPEKKLSLRHFSGYSTTIRLGAFVATKPHKNSLEVRIGLGNNTMQLYMHCLLL